MAPQGLALFCSRAYARATRCSARARPFSSVASKCNVVRYGAFGSPGNVLRLDTEERPTAASLRGSQVLVKMLAAAINPADLNMIEGTYGLRPSLPAVGGNEGCGVVEAVAPGAVGHTLRPGDRVIVSRPGLGTWRSAGVFDAADLAAVPGDVAPEVAASISVNPMTALRLLTDFVELRPGDVVVQNAATSQVGKCVIQLAAARGIRTVNVVRPRPDLTDINLRLRDLGGTVVVSEEFLPTPECQRMLAELPKPRLALNAVGGTSATEIMRLLGDAATMVTYGGMSRKPVTVSTAALIFKDLTVKGFWMSRWAQTHPPEVVAAERNRLFDMIRRGQLRLDYETWPVSDLSGALARATQPAKDAKVVLRLDE